MPGLSLYLNANKFVRLSVTYLMTICLKIWAKPLDKKTIGTYPVGVGLSLVSLFY